MSTHRLPSIALTALLLAAPAGAQPSAPQTLHRERAVLLMRHGVRPPTKMPALDPAIAPGKWPAWDVPPGDLTSHGAAAISLLGAYDRQFFAPVLKSACPGVTVYADVDERTVATGKAFVSGFAPGCAITVQHAASKSDPLFSPMDGGKPGFDTAGAKAAMLAAAGGDVNAPVTAHQSLFNDMQAVLEPQGNAFLSLRASISAKTPATLPKLKGPLAEGSSAAEDFLLEYLDGKPMKDVAWGRADKAKITELLALHPLAYTVTARPAPIAEATAVPLAGRILEGLTQGPGLTVLVGHDTNQAELGGLLGLHWSLPDYPADDPPPGGGIIFSLLSDGIGHEYVTATYMVQSMEQIRDLQKLDTHNPPESEALAIPGCGNSVSETACTLANFKALISAR